MPLATAKPGWIYPGAKFDLDFQNQRYWGGPVGIVSSTSSSLIIGSMIQGNTASQAAVAPDSNGNYIDFAADLPRITPGCGLWAEGSYTNSALWCRDFTNAAWTKSSMTAAKDQAGANGAANAASSLTATANNATALQSITLASTGLIVSAVIKRITGSGTVSLTMDNGSTWTDKSSLINSTGYTMVQIPTQTLANPTVGVKLGTSGDKIAIDYFQCENNALGATTPIVTTSASVTRGAGASDEPAINDPNQVRTNNGLRILNDVLRTGGPWSVLCVATGNSPSNGRMFISDSANAIQIQNCTGGGAAIFNGVATSANSGNFGLGNLNKAAGRVRGQSSGNCSVSLNGGAIASGTFTVLTPSTAISHTGLGNNGAGAVPLNGYILRLAFWDKEITDGQMIEWTK